MPAALAKEEVRVERVRRKVVTGGVHFALRLVDALIGERGGTGGRRGDVRRTIRCRGIGI